MEHTCPHFVSFSADEYAGYLRCAAYQHCSVSADRHLLTATIEMAGADSGCCQPAMPSFARPSPAKRHWTTSNLNPLRHVLMEPLEVHATSGGRFRPQGASNLHLSVPVNCSRLRLRTGSSMATGKKTRSRTRLAPLQCESWWSASAGGTCSSG